MSTLVLSTSNSFLQLLNEPNKELKNLALKKLIKVVDSNWAEIAEYISDIEKIYEDESVIHKPLAAFLASKIYYHLE